MPYLHDDPLPIITFDIVRLTLYPGAYRFTAPQKKKKKKKKKAEHIYEAC